MELSRNLSVSNTNVSNGRPSAVRIYKHGHMVAEVLINKHNPLGYLQGIVYHSKYLNDLSKQLLNNTAHYLELASKYDEIPKWALYLEDIEVLQKEVGLKVYL